MPQRAKILVLEEQDSFEAAAQRLLGLLFKEYSAKREFLSLLRIEASIKNVDLFKLLGASACEKKFYWSDRNRSIEWMGLGTAIQLTANSFSRDLANQMRKILDAFGDSVQFFAASRFALNSKKDSACLWDGFPSHCFVLPIFELKITEGSAELALNITSPDDGLEKAIELLEDLSSEKAPPKKQSLPTIEREARVMSQADWKDIIQESGELISKGVLQKIVLANAEDLWLEGDIDPVWLLAQLNDRASLTYRFLFQLSPKLAFVGASPEQLYARNGQRIESEAQAGTRPRGKDSEEDARLAEQLLDSKKEFVEHDVVVHDIEKALSALCKDSGWIDQRKIIKLSHVQHLRSRFGGILADGVLDFEILEALHPTPAVCGWPKEVARNYIAELENFDRGYYCGPIGMMGKSKTEFAVALRSALVSERKVRLFAGAGIVEGSIAENEWNEIDSKMRLYYDIFGKRS